MSDQTKIGDLVQVYFDSKFGEKEGWYDGVIIKIDPYSDHRSFYWVELSSESQKKLNVKIISVFNPKNIRQYR